MISIEESGQKQVSQSENISVGLDKESEKAKPKGTNIVSESDQVAASVTVIASPATRQLARDMKIDLHKVVGSGAAGKISKEDILAYAERLKGSVLDLSPSTPKSDAVGNIAALPDFAKFGKIERVPMRSLRRKTAQLMALSWSKIPHVTHCDEANITGLEKFRIAHQDLVKKQGAKLTLTTFIMKAVSIALQEFPELNTSFDEQSEDIIFKHYYNLGMAVATQRGLMVPVIKSVDKKSIIDLAKEIGEIAERARAAKSELSELQGASFSITNIGAIGGTSATPIIHYPEAAILAVMKTVEKPIVKNGQIEIGLILPLCLAFDHRLADGEHAARLCAPLSKCWKIQNL